MLYVAKVNWIQQKTAYMPQFVYLKFLLKTDNVYSIRPQIDLMKTNNIKLYLQYQNEIRKMLEFAVQICNVLYDTDVKVGFEGIFHILTDVSLSVILNAHIFKQSTS